VTLPTAWLYLYSYTEDGMLSISTIEQLAHLDDGRKLAAIYLASGFDTVQIDWLSDVWWAIDELSGTAWDVVAPMRHKIEPRRRPNPDDYDFRLARDMARMYGLDHADLPCLVFDSFDDTSKQLFVRLDDPHAMRDLLHAIDRTIRTYEPGQYVGASTFRRRLIEHVYDRALQHGAARGFMRLVPKVGSAAFRLLTGKLS
jgi:hypothetical protein